MIHNIPQPDFEEFVSQSLRYDKNVEIKMGFAFVACEQVRYDWKDLPKLHDSAIKVLTLFPAGQWKSHMFS